MSSSLHIFVIFSASIACVGHGERKQELQSGSSRKVQQQLKAFDTTEQSQSFTQAKDSDTGERIRGAIDALKSLATLLVGLKPIAAFNLAGLAAGMRPRDPKLSKAMQRRIAHAQMSAAVAADSGLAPTVVFGPGSVEMRLLIAKLAARVGHPVAIFAGDKQVDLMKRWRQLMYGRNITPVVEETEANVLCSTDDLGERLGSAEVLCIVCDTEPLNKEAIATLSNNSPNLKRIVLVSKMGVTRAKPSFMNMGSKDVEILALEETIRKEVAKRSLQLSVVRVGTLKGGGPGANVTDSSTKTYSDDAALGLTKVFYDGLTELETYMTTAAHDKFTLGAKLTAGDPFDLPNPFMRAAMKGSFDASDSDTNRIVAATAVVKSLSFGKDVEMSVSSVAGRTLPSEEDWEAMFAKL